MKYDDLFLVPYRQFGRTRDGMDCYGLVLEVARRDGKTLRDFVYENKDVPGEKLGDVLGQVNIKTVPYEERQTGDVVQWLFNNNLHCGYIVGGDMVLNMTYSGARLTPIQIIKNPTIGRII